MTKATQKQMDYIEQYQIDNYDRVLIRLPKGTKARIQAISKSVNGFIAKATLTELDKLDQDHKDD